jgi:hypothetical protein
MGPSRQDLTAVASLEELAVPGRGTYRLVRFRSGEFGVTRDGTPLVVADSEREAAEMFAVVVGRVPVRGRRRPRGR